MTAWTGGQYSLFRFALGAYLAFHFARLLPWGTELFSREGMIADRALSPFFGAFPNPLFLWDSPVVVMGMLGLAIAASLAFAVGWKDRVASLLVWFVWACLYTRNPLIANPSLPFIGWILLAHATLPRAPFLSVEARGRTDPGGNWTYPQTLFVVAWIVMALGYSYSGYTKLISPSWLDGSALSRILENPLARPGFAKELLLLLPELMLRAATWASLGLELLFAPLALFTRLRPWLWLAMIGMHLSLITLIDFADLSVGMLMIHGFTFDPAWLKPKTSEDGSRLFYDGACGLCHRAVRLVLAEDPSAAIRLAPLESESFRNASAALTPEDIPDSLAFDSGDGRLRFRSEGMLALGEALGGSWRALAIAARIIPRPIRDISYDAIASVRLKLFARPSDACPLIPAELRQRFEL